MSNRRTFLKQTAAIGGALGLSPLAKLPLEAAVPLTRPNPGRAPAPLNILILGGTGFTGPEQVEYAYGRTAGYQRRSAAKALAKGLTLRPLAVTAKDTLDWHKTRPAEEQAATLEGKINGLSMKREAEVLAAWKEELAKRAR